MTNRYYSFSVFCAILSGLIGIGVIVLRFACHLPRWFNPSVCIDRSGIGALDQTCCAWEAYPWWGLAVASLGVLLCFYSFFFLFRPWFQRFSVKTLVLFSSVVLITLVIVLFIPALNKTNRGKGAKDRARPVFISVGACQQGLHMIPFSTGVIRVRTKGLEGENCSVDLFVENNGVWNLYSCKFPIKKNIMSINLKERAAETDIQFAFNLEEFCEEKDSGT